jgi:hypothetical protein
MVSYSSSEAAQMLGVAPITLRKFSAAFAAWLSPLAAETAQVGESWERFYTDDDMDVLRHGAALYKQNRDYAWVRERLAAEFGQRDADLLEPELQPSGTAADAHPHAVEAEVIDPASQPSGAAADHRPRFVEAEVIEPEPQVPPDIAAMLERMAELYQELLRNKEQEIAALRRALDMSEIAAASERRELETMNQLTKMMERENQRLTSELEEARRQLGQAPAPTARRGLLSRLVGRDGEEAQSAPQT